MNKPKSTNSIHVYNKCQIENCLNAGIFSKIGNRTLVLCKKHSSKLDFDEYIDDISDEPELFDEFGDRIIY